MRARAFGIAGAGVWLACGGGWLVVACCRAGAGVWSSVLLACGLAVWPAPCCRSCARACACWLLRGSCWPAPGAHGQPGPACLLPILCSPAGGSATGRTWEPVPMACAVIAPGVACFRCRCPACRFSAPDAVGRGFMRPVWYLDSLDIYAPYNPPNCAFYTKIRHRNLCKNNSHSSP